jgi:hypothetical protein
MFWPKIFNWRKTGNYASNPLDRVFFSMLADSRADSSVAPQHDFAAPRMGSGEDHYFTLTFWSARQGAIHDADFHSDLDPVASPKGGRTMFDQGRFEVHSHIAGVSDSFGRCDSGARSTDFEGNAPGNNHG